MLFTKATHAELKHFTLSIRNVPTGYKAATGLWARTLPWSILVSAGTENWWSCASGTQTPVKNVPWSSFIKARV